MPAESRQPGAAAGGARALPGWPLQLVAVAAFGLVLWVVYGGGYVTLDSMWAVVWGRDVASADPLSFSGTTTPHVLSNLIGAALTPFGADADRGLVVIAFLAAGALVWTTAALAREIAGTLAGVVAGVLMVLREQLLYAATSNFLDVLTAALIVWAALIVVRWYADEAAEVAVAPAPPWSAVVLLFLAGLLRPEAWALAGAMWLWTVARDGGLTARPTLAHLKLGRLAVVVAAPVSWLMVDAAWNGDALFSVHETTRVNALVRTGRGIPDTLVEHVISIPRNIAHVAGPEMLVLAGLVAFVALWPQFARRGPLGFARLGDAQRRPVLLLTAGSVVFVAVIAAEALSGSLLFARFALALMAVFVVFGAVLVAGVAESLAERWASRRLGAGPIAAGLVVVLALAQAPLLIDARRITGEEHERYEVARAALRPGVPCRPVATPNVNIRAFVAAWTGLRGGEVVDAASSGVPPQGTYVSATGAEPEHLLRDPSFKQLGAFPPADLVRSEGGWVVTSRCGSGG